MSKNKKPTKSPKNSKKSTGQKKVDTASPLKSKKPPKKRVKSPELIDTITPSPPREKSDSLSDSEETKEIPRVTSSPLSWKNTLDKDATEFSSVTIPEESNNNNVSTNENTEQENICPSCALKKDLAKCKECEKALQCYDKHVFSLDSDSYPIDYVIRREGHKAINIFIDDPHWHSCDLQFQVDMFDLEDSEDPEEKLLFDIWLQDQEMNEQFEQEGEIVFRYSAKDIMNYIMNKTDGVGPYMVLSGKTRWYDEDKKFTEEELKQHDENEKEIDSFVEEVFRKSIRGFFDIWFGDEEETKEENVSDLSDKN